MVARVEEQGIEIRLGEEATIDRVEALAPCGVFIAAGAQPFIPPIPGIDRENVVTAEDVLSGRADVEGDCIIIGSGMTGLETAEAVATAGHKTTIADLLPEIGVGAEIIVILDMKERLAQYDPSYLPGHRLTTITSEGVELDPVDDGSTVFVPADTVILAMGVRPRSDVVEYIQAHFPDARVMGDAVRGGRIVDATQDAYGQAFAFEP